MITGLKVTVAGPELKQLCLDRAKYHAGRSEFYRNQLETLKSMDIVGTSSRPGDAADGKIREHDAYAAEMGFIANHLDTTETYILDTSDLVRLGVTYNRW